MRKGEIEERIDPDMILYKRKLLEFKFPVKQLKQLLKEKPQYGSNQAGIDRNSINEPRYIRITDINEYGLLKNSLGVTAEIVEEKYVLKNNDILFARSGATVGKAYLHKSKAVDYECFYAGYMIRFLVNENLLLPEFLFYYTQLEVYKEWVKAIQRAAGQPNINAEEYKSLSIPVPLIEEQNQILAVFEKAYVEKKQKEAAAAALLASIDGYLLQALGITLPSPSAPKKCFYTRASKVSGGRFDASFYQPSFAHVIEKINSGLFNVHPLKNVVCFSTETWNGKDYFVEKFPYIEISEIDISFGEIRNINYVQINEAPSRAKMIVRNGDLLISTTRPNRGAITHVEQPENEVTIASTGFAILRETKNKEINKNYLLFILKHPITLAQMEQRSSGGNYPAITSEELGKILIPLPPLEKQTEIANHISTLRAQAKSLQQQAAAELEQAKQQVEQLILGD